MKELFICNRQRAHPIDTTLLHQIATNAIESDLQLESYSLAVQIVSPKKMAEVNWDFLQHEGSTDVITFDYHDYPEHETLDLAGELFISFEDAIKQSKEFSTTPEAELVRYVVHGVLHLIGYDDLSPDKRKVMKREETRIVKALQKRFDFHLLVQP